MEKNFVGRSEEQEILRGAYQSKEAEMVAVIGRRRVGKTFLINQVLGAYFTFELTGLQNAGKSEQLAHFSFSLQQQSAGSYPRQTPSTWLEAFQQLVLYLDTLPKAQRQVIFFDELPWLATAKSGFLTGLGFFWNSWAVKNNVVVVICGSAASWMIKKIVNNTGGLYNRVTKRIFLQPFTLAETATYLKNKNISTNHYQILLLYMALGGIPHYLKEVQAGKSAVQNIDSICFSKNGLLRNEFSRLFNSLFDDAERHTAIIRTLSTTHGGISRRDLIKKSKLSEGGSTTKVLEELEHSGFITSYFPFGKSQRNRLYRLTDEYSLFYLKFMEGKQAGKNTWNHLSQTQAFKIWSGYAFENICIKHLEPIKKALGISGIYSEASTFYQSGNEQQPGAQIDLVLDRKDQVINLFEIKFYNTEFSISESYAQQLRKKMSVFQEVTKTRKHLMLVFITTFGLQQNAHSLGLVEGQIELSALFE